MTPHGPVWHPFTQMAQWEDDDHPVIERGEGHYLIDTQGNRYLDGVSSLWVSTFGHRRREIDEAIRAQLDRIAHSTMLGLGCVPTQELAQALVRIAPEGLKHVFFGSDGASAVEAALKLSLQYWQQCRPAPQPGKQAILKFQGAYHGDTLGAVTVGDMPLFHGRFPSLFRTFTLPYPRTGDDPSRAAGALDTLLQQHGREIAAVIVEPLIQAANGMITMLPGYLATLRNICTRYQVLLIADEVATGFGKTGAMFACDREHVTPDILVVGKGLTGGYLPVSATLATDGVYEAFLGRPEECRQFFHGHSFAGNALGCAAACANLRIFETDHILERLQATIAHLTTRLERFKSLLHVREVRQCGIMTGIELINDRTAGIPYKPADQIGQRVVLAARKRGVIIRPLGPVIVLMPPLTITEDEVRMLTDVAYEAIVKATDG